MIGLTFDQGEMQRIAREFDASEKDLRRAYARALSRTARKMRTQARKALREGLDLRAASILKARLRLARMRPRGKKIGAARLWVGANDLPATAFKGRPRQTATGARVGGREFPGAFVGTSADSGKRMVFRRAGRSRLPIFRETVPVQDEVNAVLEGEVFDDMADAFMAAFRAEVRARTIYGVG
ncbi:phage tail protein [Roseovarius ramblicola]|uniref:Phage tail protein n=1 Tax=Roseovarius ramblicola TaxID=2022336 RepID=A0ABV5I0C4_9RHOB